MLRYLILLSICAGCMEQLPCIRYETQDVLMPILMGFNTVSGVMIPNYIYVPTPMQVCVEREQPNGR